MGDLNCVQPQSVLLIFYLPKPERNKHRRTGGVTVLGWIQATRISFKTDSRLHLPASQISVCLIRYVRLSFSPFKTQSPLVTNPYAAGKAPGNSHQVLQDNRAIINNTEVMRVKRRQKVNISPYSLDSGPNLQSRRHVL